MVLSCRITTLRECCDELVCREGDGRSERARTDYASALLRIVELAGSAAISRSKLAALAADGHFPSELRCRVARLVGEPLQESSPISWRTRRNLGDDSCNHRCNRLAAYGAETVNRGEVSTAGNRR
jgi:hypothetical protein